MKRLVISLFVITLVLSALLLVNSSSKADTCELYKYTGYGRYSVYQDDYYLNSLPCKVVVTTKTGSQVTVTGLSGIVYSNGIEVSITVYSTNNVLILVDSETPLKSFKIYK